MLVTFGYILKPTLRDFPVGAEPVEQSRRVGRARDRAQEAAVARLDDIGDAGEALLGEQRRRHAALRGAAGMQALHHRAFLRRHQAGAERARDADRVLHLLGTRASAGGRR